MLYQITESVISGTSSSCYKQSQVCLADNFALLTNLMKGCLTFESLYPFPNLVDP